MNTNLQKKILLVSRVAFIVVQLQCLLGAMLLANTGSRAQHMSDIYLTVSWQDASLDEVFTSLNEKTGFRFLYEERKIGKIKGVSLTANNQSLEGILKDLSVEKKLQFRRVNKTIAVQLFENLNDQNRVVELADVDITGKITDENGEGLPGASVIEKGTSNGTTTDLDGNFKLGLDEAATLVVSFVGYKTMEVAIAGRSTIDLQMELDAEQLEEVVVVGYGVQKKVNLTGSVESVSEEDIVSRPVGQASMALQGLAPGVTVTQNSGKPGSDGGVIRIRGIGTIGDSNPLVLVDGIPFNLNDVDVNEIESISVLKDAASAAIYGSRAANGVVLVTTKRAKTNQFSINYRASVGWQQPTELMQKVSGYDHMVMINEASRNVGQSEPFTQQYIDEYKASSPSDDYPETNWHDVMLKDRAFQQNQYVSINSGGDKISLLGSISFLDQDGIMHSDYQRVNYRINTDIKLKENIQFKLDMLGKTEGNEEPPQSWHWLARYPHNLAGLNEDGSWGIGWDGNNGWATMVDGGKSYDNTDDLVVNMKMDWQPFEGLNVGIQYAPNKSYRHYKSFRKHVNLFYPDGFVINPSPYKAQLTEQYTKTNSNNYKALVSYDKSIRDHSLAFLLGWEAIDYKSEWIRGFRDQYPLENYEVLNVGSTANQTANGSAAEWALMSYFSRVNYNFKEKYLFEANVRIDGSSRFAEGYKYGLFPSFSAGWRISEEAFMSDVSSTWLYNLKLRASWGRLGNQSIGNYPFASGVSTGLDYVFGNDSPALGAGLLNAANPQISWETTEMVNVGLDAGMGKFSITADYYIKNTYDILLRLPVPQIAGLSAPYQNAGKVRNKGWDFRVQFDDNVGELNYSIGANLSDVKNEVVDLVGTGPYIFERTAHFEGQPIDALYGLQSSGLFQNQSEVDSHASQFGPVSPGDIRYVDQSVDVDGDGLVDEPDGIVNASDRVVMGSTIPRYTYGLNLNFQYKGLDLGMFFQGVGKVDGYLDNFATQAFYLGGTAQEWHKDHWSENNPNAPYPRLTFNFPNNEQVSSYWVRSAAYFRMKNLQIGYSLPRKVIDKVSINKCRFFVSAQNLFTIDDFYNSFDPESPVGGGEFYPMVKVFVFGIETTF